MFTKTIQASCHRFNINNQNRLISRQFEEVPYEKAKCYFYNDAFPFTSNVIDEIEDKVKVIDNEKNKNPRGSRKSVSFSNLEIREHAIVIGDHPFCEGKLPLSLGWSHAPQTTISIDSYESCRGPRKDRSSLRMSYFERKNVLKRISGLTERDIVREERRYKSMQDLKSLPKLYS